MLQRFVWVGLVVPPGGFLLLCVVGLLLSARTRLGRVLLFVGVAGLVVSALPIFDQVVFAALDRGMLSETQSSTDPQAIVILSGDVAHTARGFEPGPGTLQRLRVGAALWRRTRLPILVIGGPVWSDDPPVARVMAESLEADFNVPVRWVEDRSTDTLENARESAAILHAAGLSSVYVVTHAWHLKRARLAFMRYGIAASPAPVLPDRGPDDMLYLLLPRPSAWVASYEGLHELIGLVFYSLRGS